ncbi:hypothetical protein TP70_03255 [Staphylococcus microti]|uniref:Uncharacterized protein n=1 Tax=Staphylococcus microti TaxID=569857 RepID=A0ABR5C9E3_9STAP|nr:hypothetical protein TP70_03255 [Staphylococcus microti]PNZ82752.1 hypothetical protein CD132_03330 [Staphylococcus microti]
MPSSIKVIFGNLKIYMANCLLVLLVLFSFYIKSVNTTMELDTNGHIEYLLHYPLILATK